MDLREFSGVILGATLSERNQKDSDLSAGSESVPGFFQITLDFMEAIPSGDIAQFTFRG